jgi:hypothetical protein
LNNFIWIIVVFTALSMVEASVADVKVTVGLTSIGVQLLQAEATALCDFGYTSVGGSSDILGLIINGKKMKVTGQPNQTIHLLNGTAIINEQSYGSNTMTVRQHHHRPDHLRPVIEPYLFNFAVFKACFNCVRWEALEPQADTHQSLGTSHNRLRNRSASILLSRFKHELPKGHSYELSDYGIDQNPEMIALVIKALHE